MSSIEHDPLFQDLLKLKATGRPAAVNIVQVVSAAYNNREIIREQIRTLNTNHHDDPTVVAHRVMLKNFMAEQAFDEKDLQATAAKIVFAWDTDNHGHFAQATKLLETTINRQKKVMELISRIVVGLKAPE